MEKIENNSQGVLALTNKVRMEAEYRAVRYGVSDHEFAVGSSYRYR